MIDWNLTFACFILSILTTYAFWCWFRVWYFRQRLFIIRDELWSRMHARGMLDDPEYQSFRDAINAMIRTAPIFSVSTCLYLALVRDLDLDQALKTHDDSDVRLARNKTIDLAVRYLMFESLTGLMLTAFLLLNGIWLLSFSKAQSVMGKILDSRKLISLKRGDDEHLIDPSNLVRLH